MNPEAEAMSMSNKPSEGRITVIQVVIIVWMMAIGAKLVWLQVRQHDWLVARAIHQQQAAINLSPMRGVIYDRNGNELARSGGMRNRFAVLVEGVNDSSLVTEIEQTIRDSLQEMAVPGSWRVIVRCVSGRWDFSVHGVDVRHTLSVAVPSDLLPSLIAPGLGESLSDLCSVKLKNGAH